MIVIIYLSFLRKTNDVKLESKFFFSIYLEIGKIYYDNCSRDKQFSGTPHSSPTLCLGLFGTLPICFITVLNRIFLSIHPSLVSFGFCPRSEERRVGKDCCFSL